MVKLNVNQYFFLIIACALYSCQPYHRMEVGSISDKIRYFFTKPTKPASGYEPLNTVSPPLPEFCVVLCPSPGVNTSITDQTKKEVEKKFGKKVTVIQIKCLEQLKATDEIGPPDVDSVYTELLCTLVDRLNFKKAWGNLTADKYFRELPIHILCCEDTSSIFHAITNNATFLQHSFNVQTLAVVGTVDHEAVANANAIPFFHGSEDETQACIDFLVKKHPIPCCMD